MWKVHGCKLNASQSIERIIHYQWQNMSKNRQEWDFKLKLTTTMNSKSLSRWTSPNGINTHQLFVLLVHKIHVLAGNSKWMMQQREKLNFKEIFLNERWKLIHTLAEYRSNIVILPENVVTKTFHFCSDSRIKRCSDRKFQGHNHGNANYYAK